MSALSFTNGYRDAYSQPKRNIASYTTADLKFSYRFSESQTGWLGDSALIFDVRNVLNRAPPFVNNPLGIGYDPSNGMPGGQTVELERSEEMLRTTN